MNCQIIQQMWPYIGKVAVNKLKAVVEPDISQLLPSIASPFKFESVDFGYEVSSTRKMFRISD